jgi:hypothetical protein
MLECLSEYANAAVSYVRRMLKSIKQLSGESGSYDYLTAYSPPLEELCFSYFIREHKLMICAVELDMMR